MKVELTEQQLNNLIIFLNRVELKGEEALAYVDILATIENSVQDDKSNAIKQDDN